MDVASPCRISWNFNVSAVLTNKEASLFRCNNDKTFDFPIALLASMARANRLVTIVSSVINWCAIGL